MSRDDLVRRATRRLQERTSLSPFEARRLADELIRDFEATLQPLDRSAGQTEEIGEQSAGPQWFWLLCEAAVLAILVIAAAEYFGVLS